MFQRCLNPLDIPVHQHVDRRRRCQLFSDVPHHTQRRRRPIGQESAQKPDRPQLHRKPDPMMITPPRLHPPAVGVVQKEEPLQLRAAGLTVEPPINRGLIIAEELHRHKINLMDHRRP